MMATYQLLRLHSDDRQTWILSHQRERFCCVSIRRIRGFYLFCTAAYPQENPHEQMGLGSCFADGRWCRRCKWNCWASNSWGFVAQWYSRSWIVHDRSLGHFLKTKPKTWGGGGEEEGKKGKRRRWWKGGGEAEGEKEEEEEPEKLNVLI